MEKALVAKTLANKLLSAESAVDEAIARASVLLGGLIDAKSELNLSVTFGDPALAKVSEAIAALSASRTALVAAHTQLDDSRKRIGVRSLFTPQAKPEPTPTHFAVDTRDVREVG